MNKTLLIVICDFLLLSMLGMISFDDIATSKEKSNDDLLVTSYADSQLVDLLKMSLDKERENRDNLSSKVDEYSSKAKEVEDISKEQAIELAKKQEALESLEAEKAQALDLAEKEKLEKEAIAQDKAKALSEAEALQAKLQSETAELQSRLQSEALAKELLENDKTQALAQAQSLEAKLQSENQAKQDLEAKIGEFSESDALLKARLEAMQAELELTKANEEFLKKENAQIQEQSKELNAQLEVEKTKANIYQEDLQRAQILVWQEKTEKQQIQEHAQTLALGVDKLAQSQDKIVQSQDNLSKKVDEIRPLSASEIYENFKGNALNIDISYKRNTLFGDSEKSENTKAIILDIDGEYLAVFSVEGTIFESYFRANQKNAKVYPPESLQITPWAKGLKFNLPTLSYLNGFGRILAFKVPSAFIEQTKIKTYSIAQNSFKHSEAIVIDGQKLYYGQLKYNVDEKSSIFANVDASFFSSIFGDFSPSAGNLVLDRSNNFLGFMWTSSKLVLPKTFRLSTPLALSSKYNKDAAASFIGNMKSGK